MTYSCSNQPRPTDKTTYPGKSPIFDHSRGGTIVESRLIKIPYVFSTECKYDKSDKDQRCSECKFKRKII